MTQQIRTEIVCVSCETKSTVIYAKDDDLELIYCPFCGEDQSPGYDDDDDEDEWNTDTEDLDLV